MLCKFVPSTTSLFVFAKFQELSHFLFHFRCQSIEWRSSCVSVECKLPCLIIIAIILGMDALDLIDLVALLELRNFLFYILTIQEHRKQQAIIAHMYYMLKFGNKFAILLQKALTLTLKLSLFFHLQTTHDIRKDLKNHQL